MISLIQFTNMKCDHCIERYFVYNFSVLATVGFVVNALNFFYYICMFQELLDCVIQEAAKQFCIVMYTRSTAVLHTCLTFPFPGIHVFIA